MNLRLFLCRLQKSWKMLPDRMTRFPCKKRGSYTICAWIAVRTIILQKQIKTNIFQILMLGRRKERVIIHLAFRGTQKDWNKFPQLTCAKVWWVADGYVT